MMIFRFIDKMIFAAILLLALQVPQLADHYLQYLQGYFDATAEQVEGFRLNALQNGYADIDAMLQAHLQNSVASVRTDAEQKQQTLVMFEELGGGLTVFREGNLLEQSVWMFNPERSQMLKSVLQNFVPGIPLSPMAFVFAVITALISNILIASPVYFFQWRKRRKMSFNGAYRGNRRRSPTKPPEPV